MEDKQIYTSARSEEIKRQLKSAVKKIAENIEKYRKKRKEAQKAKAAKVIPVSPAPAPPKEKPQNIQISVNGLNPQKASYKKTVTKAVGKHLQPVSPEESLFSTVTYILLALIIFIIALGAFLASRK